MFFKPPHKQAKYASIGKVLVCRMLKTTTNIMTDFHQANSPREYKRKTLRWPKPTQLVKLRQSEPTQCPPHIRTKKSAQQKTATIDNKNRLVKIPKLG